MIKEILKKNPEAVLVGIIIATIAGLLFGYGIHSAF